MQGKITKFLLLAASRSPVFRDKISCLWVGGSFRTRALNKGTPSKRRYFDLISSSSVTTVADRYTHVAYLKKALVTGFLNLSTSMTLNDLEPPPKNRF